MTIHRYWSQATKNGDKSPGHTQQRAGWPRSSSPLPQDLYCRVWRASFGGATPRETVPRRTGFVCKFLSLPFLQHNGYWYIHKADTNISNLMFQHLPVGSTILSNTGGSSRQDPATMSRRFGGTRCFQVSSMNCTPVAFLIYSRVNTCVEGRGFIQHPEISPVPHGLAVFHQLHCLVSKH